MDDLDIYMIYIFIYIIYVICIIYNIPRFTRSCDLSIYSFKKWQRLTRIFDDKKIEMQTTTKEIFWGGGRRAGEISRGRESKRKI